MEEVKFFGCLYFYIHSKLKEKTKGKNLNYRDAKCYLHKWRIPKYLRAVVMRELEILGLISIEKDNVTIKESKVEINHPFKVYELIGLIDEKKCN